MVRNELPGSVMRSTQDPIKTRIRTIALLYLHFCVLCRKSADETRLIHLLLPITGRLNMSDPTVYEEEDYIKPASSGKDGGHQEAEDK